MCRKATESKRGAPYSWEYKDVLNVIREIIVLFRTRYGPTALRSVRCAQ